MPERAYADIVGNFNRGRAGAYARRNDYEGAAQALAVDDPAASEAYRARGRQEEETAYRRGYGSDIASGNYEGAAARAGKFGDIEGLSGARTAQVQMSEQHRTEVWRGFQRTLAELQQIEANGGQGYDEWLARGRERIAQIPDIDPAMREFADGLPQQWSPRVTGYARNWLTSYRDGLLTPEQAAQFEMTGRQRDTQERQADIAERRAAAAETTAEAAMLRAERAGSGGSSQEFSRANSLRDEYNQQTAGYRTIADFSARSEQYVRRANAGQPSGQGDVGLVYALAKIYDPTSVVREGEFAMVARQGGYGEQMQSWVQTALGRGFSPAIRNQIMAEIRNGVRAAEGQRNQTRTRYESLAQRAGLDPALVIDDYTGGSPAAPAAPAPGGAPQRPPGVPPTARWNPRTNEWEE